MSEMNSHFSKKDFTNFQRFNLIILYVKENKSLRQFCLDLQNSKWVNYLQLKKIPKKSTINSWFKFFDLSKIKKLIQKFIFENKIFAIDGTGLDRSIKSSYYQKRLIDKIISLCFIHCIFYFVKNTLVENQNLTIII